MSDAIKIQPGDKVKFVNLSDNGIEKIAKFTGRLYSADSGEWFKKYGGNLNGATITIENIQNSPKTKTEFASCILRLPSSAAVRIYIQTRYLEFVSRKHKHPLTLIFTEWWRPRG